ncbi:hypothetical protein K1719_004882 [Acacia pycnantha]|nr:hypothetical protein K1719_004882 [Acacia pycnantha]
MAQPVFTVKRHEPELNPAIFIYAQKPSMEGKDPTQIIKKALSETLAFYYPFAGRLREAPAGKLMVDCNEEGVIFIEADADVTLEQFGHPLQAPFPCFEEILYDVPGSDGVINSPSCFSSIPLALSDQALQLDPDQEVRFICVSNACTRSNTSFVLLRP